MATPQEQIEIIQAYERGEEIECRISLSKWYTLGSKEEFIKETGCEYKFNFSNIEYRIKKKRWRADVGCNYFCINGYGEINKLTQIDGDSNAQLYKLGNYFRTKEDAEKARELIKNCLTQFHEENE